MGAVLRTSDSELARRLSSVREFVRGYECTEQFSEQALQAGIPLQIEEFGLGGITEGEWQEFGPVKKTMAEFWEAYERFLERCIKLASGSR